MAAARRSGSDAALAWVLGFHSQTLWGTSAELQESERAVAHAPASGDRFLLSHAASLRANCFSSLADYAGAADSTLEIIGELRTTGSFYEAVQLMPIAGLHLLELGRGSEVLDLLCDGLSRRVTSNDGGDLRRVAAELAARTGDLAAAGEHLARARELSPHRQILGDLIMVSTELRVEIVRGRTGAGAVPDGRGHAPDGPRRRGWQLWVDATAA